MSKYIVIGTYRSPRAESRDNGRLLTGLVEADTELEAVKKFDARSYVGDVLSVTDSGGTSGEGHGYWLHEVQKIQPPSRWEMTSTRLTVLGDQDA